MGSLRRWAVIAVVVGCATLVTSFSALAAGKQTFTGEVGDVMCGKAHMEGSPEECTRSCVKHGSKYALIVGDKVYTLNTSDKAALATLDQQAGKKATVTGTASGDAIEVNSVAAAK